MTNLARKVLRTFRDMKGNRAWFPANHYHFGCSRYCLTVGLHCMDGPWAPSQYPKRRLFVRSRKVSKPRDWYFKLSYRFEIWQAHRQHCCRSACQISERSDNSKYKSRGFETLRYLTERRLFGYWDGALDLSVILPWTQSLNRLTGISCCRRNEVLALRKYP